jgi:ribonuclease BN (tRNA processing enzyme)
LEGWLRVKFLGTHNTETKHTGYVSFLIDNVIAFEAGSLTSHLEFTEQKAIKALFVSHCHYDHVKCVPSLAFNLSRSNPSKGIPVFALPQTQQTIASHLLDGIIYPEYSESYSYMGMKILELRTIVNFESVEIGTYKIKAFPVKHSVEAVGFEVTAKGGESLFYTGDTGPGLSHIWEHISPKAIFIDATFPNRLNQVAIETGHLCPQTIEDELLNFKKINGYLPKVFLLHRSPELETEIRKDAELITAHLGISIEMPPEDSTLSI